MGVSHSFPIGAITPTHNALILITILDSGVTQMPEGSQERAGKPKAAKKNAVALGYGVYLRVRATQLMRHHRHVGK
ncbi:hypothetical protein CF124_05850 [Aeromonas hydrophila]|nr:hypothetical protein CF124_05850 [Aeromonas hydrophila]